MKLRWYHLSDHDMTTLEIAIVTFLKTALPISNFTASRLVYELTRESLFIEEIRHELLLPATEAYAPVLKKRN
jgi:hypothetical protein